MFSLKTNTFRQQILSQEALTVGRGITRSAGPFIPFFNGTQQHQRLFYGHGGCLDLQLG